MRTLQSISEKDVAWAEERTVALMHLGLSFADAVELAAREYAQRITAGESQFQEALAVERQRHHDAQERQQVAERAKHRAEVEARAEQGKRERPGTLKASLGDLLKRKDVSRQGGSGGSTSHR